MSPRASRGPVTFDGGVAGTVRAQFWGTVWGWARHFVPAPLRSFRRRNDVNGAGDRNRTGDPVITSDVLYQLSYTSSAMRHVHRHGPGGVRRAGGTRDGPAIPRPAAPMRWCDPPESNWGHRDFQSRALPTELGSHARSMAPEAVSRSQDGGNVYHAISRPVNRLSAVRVWRHRARRRPQSIRGLGNRSRRSARV
jgi:hypothetical protein